MATSSAFPILHRGHLIGLVPYRFLEEVDEPADFLERRLLGLDDFLGIQVDDDSGEGDPEVSARLQREVQATITDAEKLGQDSN